MSPIAFLPPWPRRVAAATRTIATAWVGRRRLLAAAILAVALVAAGAVAHARRGGDQTHYRTAAATLGTVTQSLSLSGNLTAVGETDLAFQSSGRVTAVDVQMGQTVRSGQVLATLDTTTLQGALTQASANLQSAQAKLSLDQAGPTPQNLAQANAAVNTAEVGLRNAQAGVGDTQAVDQQTITQAQSAVASSQNTLSSDQNQLTADQNQLAADQNQLTADSASPTKAGTDQQRVTTDQHTVATDQQTLTRDQGTLDSAQNALAAAQVKSTQSYDQAVAQVSTAQTALRNAETNLAALRQVTPQQIQMDQSQVQIAQVNVDNAQRSLNDATLTAPVDGVVGQVSITVGQSVAGTGSSPSGSSASSSSGSSTGGSSTGGSSTGGSSTGGSSTGGASTGGVSTSASTSTSSAAAVVLLTPGFFEVTGTVGDAQVGQVAVGQRARVLPAGSTEAVEGKVTQISPVATVSNGVATFPVTVSLDGSNPSLHAGMTASITVILNEAVHVLTVPTSAVHTTGGGTTVTALVNDQPQVRPVTVGASDALRTEIQSGLNEGDQVVVATVTSALPSPGAGGALFGGGGAGGFRGAGGRGGG